LGLGQAADLVGERDLKSVPRVVGILDHLGQLQLGPDQRCAGARRDRSDQVENSLIDGANDHLGWLVVVPDRGALAQELWIHRDRDRQASGTL
jgi:hypothetical protein